MHVLMEHIEILGNINLRQESYPLVHVIVMIQAKVTVEAPHEQNKLWHQLLFAHLHLLYDLSHANVHLAYENEC